MCEKKIIAVAVDGPAGAGKSSIAKAVAAKKQMIYVDTGALYRAIGYVGMVNGVDINNEKELNDYLSWLKIELAYENGVQRVIVNGQDVSDNIRANEVSMLASNISKIPAVREFLLGLQREMAQKHSVIMDGRDIGTVVLPNADIKIFLTASPEIRAERRYKELLAKGDCLDYNTILADIIKRDEQDTSREIAPLKPAKDSVYVDTSELSFEESVEKILELVERIL